MSTVAHFHFSNFYVKLNGAQQFFNQMQCYSRPLCEKYPAPEINLRLDKSPRVMKSESLQFSVVHTQKLCLQIF